MKNIWNSKTFYVGLIAILTTVVPMVQDFHGTTWKDYMGLVFGVIIIVLRTFTATPIGTPSQVQAFKAANAPATDSKQP